MTGTFGLGPSEQGTEKGHSTMNRNTIRTGLLSTLVALAVAGTSQAGLLNANFVKAYTVFDQTGTLTYNRESDVLAINATALIIQFNGVEVLLANGPSPLSINIKVNYQGQLTGGVSGPDFTMNGSVDLDNDGINEYSGVLLTGEVVAFGFQNDPSGTDLYDFKFKTTGGSLAGVYGKFFGVALTSENSTFNNSFCENFNGGAKGTIGNLDGNKCARSPSYWKCTTFPNNIQSLTIGGVTYDRNQLLNMLNGKMPDGSPAGTDPNVKLARFVITVKLSLLAGASPAGDIIAKLAEADAYLAKNPPGSDIYGCNDAGTALMLKDWLKYWTEEAECTSPCDKDDWNPCNYGGNHHGYNWYPGRCN